MVTDEQIKHMRDRFLGWKLPENFNPDGGISFAKKPYNHVNEPSGTNVFDAQQAEEMIRYMLDGMPQSDAKTIVCNEILKIMVEHDRQEAKGYVDTPGGIEHKGDAFKLLGRWRTALAQPVVNDRE